MGNPHTAPLGALIALVDDLETRLTAARATKLDNLDKAISTLNDMAYTDLTGSTMCFYSEAELAAIDDTPATLTLGDVVIPSLTMPSIKHAYAGLLYNFQNAFAGDNSMQANTYIQVNKAAAGWLSAILVPNFSFIMGDGNTISGIMMGNVDVKDRVAFGSTTNFQWLSSVVVAAALNINVISVIEIIV